MYYDDTIDLLIFALDLFACIQFATSSFWLELGITRIDVNGRLSSLSRGFNLLAAGFAMRLIFDVLQIVNFVPELFSARWTRVLPWLIVMAASSVLIRRGLTRGQHER